MRLYSMNTVITRPLFQGARIAPSRAKPSDETGAPAPPKATTHRECSANALCAAVGKLRPDWPAASHTASGEHGALWPRLAIFSIAKSWRAIIPAKRFVEGVHDIAYLRINGKVVKKYDRTRNGKRKNNDGFTCWIPAFHGKCLIEILVEGMGRVNYGPYLADRKGIQRVRLGMQLLFGWEVYTLPMENLSQLSFVPEGADGGQVSEEEPFPLARMRIVSWI